MYKFNQDCSSDGNDLGPEGLVSEGDDSVQSCIISFYGVMHDNSFN